MEIHKDISSLLQSISLKKYQKHDLFHILKFEDHFQEIPLETINRKCDFFQVYFSKKYDAEIQIDDKVFVLGDQPIVSFLCPMQTLSVSIKNFGQFSNGYMLLFNPQFLQEGLSDFFLQKKFPFFNQKYPPFYSLNNNFNPFQELFEKIYNLFQSFKEVDEELIPIYLKALLIEAKKSFLNGEIENKFLSREQEITFGFENLVRQNAYKRPTIQYYADKLNISSVYLSECVKKATHKTARKIINEYEIQESKTLLIQTNKTIDEIAHILGFSATSNFVNFFKKHTQKTPSEYRNT
jgi:AraC-like DNA-binding protein